MKKFILFLVLFGLGLGVLWWLESHSERAPKQPQERPPLEPLVSPQDPLPGEPEPGPAVVPAPEAPANQSGVSIEGKFENRIYNPENGLIKLKLISESSETVGNLDRLRGVQIDLYKATDTQTEEAPPRLGVVHAKSAEVSKIRTEDNSLKWESIVRLEQLSAKMTGGQDLTDLAFESPAGVVDLRDDFQTLFRLKERISIQSKELTASGSGALITILNEQQDATPGERQKNKFQFIEIDRDAKLNFLHSAKPDEQDGPLPTLVEVTSQGTLSLNRIDRLANLSRSFEAFNGARMTLSGAQESDLRANRLQGRMLGSTTRGDLLLEGVIAEGDAVWQFLSHTFRGKYMDLETDTLGQIAKARISGFPNVLLNFDFSDAERQEQPDAAQSGEQLPLGFSQVSIQNNSEIRLERIDRRVRVTVLGPATVESKSFTLRCLGDLIFSFPLDPAGQKIQAGLVNLEASGGVAMELLKTEAQSYSRLDTEVLELGLTYVDRDTPFNFSAEAKGGAKLDGFLRDGRRLTLDTPRSLNFTRIQDNLSFQDAYDLALQIEALVGAPKESTASRAYLANCKHLIRFESSTQRLEATEGVTLVNTLGSFTGERIETLGSSHAEIWGSQAEQVLLTSDFGRINADHIKVTDSFFLIDGRVVASLVGLPTQQQEVDQLQLSRLDVHCAALEIQLLETKLQRITHGKALGLHKLTQGQEAGGVQCELFGSRRSMELHYADQLNLTKVEWYAGEDKLGKAIDSSLEVSASGQVHGHVGLDQSRFQLWADRVDVDADSSGETSDQAAVEAQGNVRFEGAWRRTNSPPAAPLVKAEAALGSVNSVAFDGSGQRLQIYAQGSAFLGAEEGQRVLLNGRLPIREDQFHLTAEEARFGPDSLDARQPEIQILPGEYRLLADRLVANAERTDLQGRTIVHGKTSLGEPWVLSADKVELLAPESASKPGLLTVIEARGNVHFQMDNIEAFADVLRRNALGLSLEGDPCSIITRRPSKPTTTVNSKWINFDIDLEVITEMGLGSITAHREGNGGPYSSSQEAQDWRIDFLSFKTELDQDSMLFFLEEPHFIKQSKTGTIRLRASYSVIWVPRDRWQDLNSLGGFTSRGSTSTEATEDQGSMDVFFQFINSQGIGELVDEVYFEGPVQTFRDEELLSHADAVYLDLRTGRGWLTGVTMNVTGSFLGREREAIKVKADWLRHSRDGSLTAERATLTPCDYDDPHLKIVTGELKLSPIKNEEEPGYSISIKHNSIDLFDLFSIPLPPLDFNTDEALKPQFPTFRFGNSTRFGQLLSVRFTQPARRLGRFFHSLFTGPEKEAGATDTQAAGDAPKVKKPYRSKYDVDASYLSSRGGLVDVGFSIRENSDRYWLEWINGLVLDTGRDRGFIRVPKRDRGKLRLWLRSQGQIKLDKSSIGFSYSDQSDPAVQSEFFESEFLRFEQDETYVQWKRREDNLWYQASAQWRVDEFRAGVEELPSTTAFQGRAPIYTLGSFDFIHSGEVNADYLRRLTPSRFDLDGDGIGESVLTSPFASNGDYADGLGQQEILRLHTTQVIEAPKSLGVAGLKFTPFATFHGTYWDTAIDEDHAARIVGDLGARLSSVMWRRNSDGGLDQFTPYVEYRNDVVNKVDGRALEIGSIERTLFGNFVQVGSRSRFDVQEDRSFFDFDIRGVYATDRSDGGPDGWLPIEVYSKLGLNPAGRRLDIWWDGRFDAEASEPVYSHFSLGTRIRDEYGAQVGYTYGRDANLVKLFDVASISGFYRWTEKWEFEARQNFSLLEDQQLGFEMVLRRYGHDTIFELESKLREGEGSAIGFSVRPRLGFKPNRIGYTYW